MKTFTAALLAIILSLGLAHSGYAQDDELSPYGTAKVNLHPYPVTNAVFDVNYEDPKDLNLLYSFVKNTMGPLKGKMVVVTHGPELRAFAKENYIKYQGIMDRMKELADAGVEFRMCNNALKAAGYEPDDFHGFITVVPAGFPEIAFLQREGYSYINPVPLSPKDVRYIDQPQLKGQ
jgi:intracellular sulfur oxidation DsrE/DsrF family protein